MYYGECATNEPFAWKRFLKWHHFRQVCISQIWDHLAMLKFLWLHNHRTICNIYSTVGRSIANVYDWGVIFTEVWSAEVNMPAEVGYRGYGPTYRATYNILYGECATGEPFWLWRLTKLSYRCHFLLKSISLLWDSAIMLNSLWLRNHHTI